MNGINDRPATDRTLALGPTVRSLGELPAPPNPKVPRLRVALVNPPDPSADPTARAAAPLGLGYLASAARFSGFHVDILDFVSDASLDDSSLRRAGLFEGDYNVVGISTYTESFGFVVDAVRAIRAMLPTTRIVLGGYHATLMPNEVLRDQPAVDAVVLNEADHTFPELLRRWSSDDCSTPDIPGVLCRRPDGTWTDGAGAVPEVALDGLPRPVTRLLYESSPYPRFADRRRRVNRRVLHVVSSRGCPKKCTFCAIIVMSPRWRARSVEALIDEIEARRAVEPAEHVLFQDANFFVDARRTLAFSRALHEYDSGMTWSGTATADHVVKHEAVLQEIGGLNCAFLELGIESGNDQSLARFNKWTKAEDNVRAVRMLARAGIPLGLDFIMFEPQMTLEDLQGNITFLRRADLADYYPSEHLYSSLKLYPGTPIRTAYEERHGLRLAPHTISSAKYDDQTVAMCLAVMNRFFSRVQQPCDVLMRRVELEVDEHILENRWAKTTERVLAVQQMQLATLALRRAPFDFMERVVSQVSDHPSDPEIVYHLADDQDALNALDKLKRAYIALTDLKEG